MKIKPLHLAAIPLIFTILSCGGSGGNGATGRFMLVTEAGTRLTKVGIPSNTRTGLTEGLTNPTHYRISQDGTRYLATIGGNLYLGATSTGLATQIAGYKLGDWDEANDRIIAVSTGNVIVPMSSDGSSALEPIYNGSAGGGISSIDVQSNMILLAMSPSGWTRIATMNTSGLNVTFLTPDSVNYSNPRWKPDGTEVVFENFASNRDLFTMNADGTGITSLVSTSASETGAVYLDNDRILYTHSPVGGTTNSIYSVAASGGLGLPAYSVAGYPKLQDIRP